MSRSLAESSLGEISVTGTAISELKDYRFLAKAANDLGLTIDRVVVDSQQAWMSAFEQANEVDFIILGTSSSIEDWDEKTVLKFVKQQWLSIKKIAILMQVILQMP